jgi:hypothetical protein
MTLEGMRDLVDQVLPVMDKRLEKILDEAQTNAIRSQVRVSACDLAGQVLDGTMDYTPAGGLYEGEDMRNGFVSVWRNLAGSEVIVTVEPEGDHEKMTIDSFEASPVSPEERLQRSHDIAQLMRECGLQVEDPKEESALPSEKNRDLEEVRKRQVARGKAAAKEVKR